MGVLEVIGWDGVCGVYRVECCVYVWVGVGGGVEV